MVHDSIKLGKVLSPPTVLGPADAGRIVPVKQPIHESGVAQVFTSPERRRKGLAHEHPANYYQRDNHPTLRELSEYLSRNLFHSNKPSVLLESGLAACVIAVSALAPRNARILCDVSIYYETDSRFIKLAGERGWMLKHADFTDLKEVAHALQEDKFDLVYLDNPRNWFLDAIDLLAVSSLTRQNGALLIVDTSVQPLQSAIAQGADIVVASLSKYPSSGQDMGGAIASHRQELLDQIRSEAVFFGHVMSNTCAGEILKQIPTLNDRLLALSQKAEKIVDFLCDHPAVKQVRYPNKELLGGLGGGQISFCITSTESGLILEQVVGQHALDPDFSLNLACTFGSTITTIEHFASNKRHREGVSREQTNEIMIPVDLVRLGIGAEGVERIIADLNFVLNVALNEARRIYTKTE